MRNGTQDLDPILIVVGDGRWECFGHTPPTPREQWLFDALTNMGGVNEHVTPGQHHFNILEMDDGTFEYSLYPVETDIDDLQHL